MAEMRVNCKRDLILNLGKTGPLSKQFVLEHLHLVSEPKLNFNIMKGTVSIGLFKQFLNSPDNANSNKPYVIKGHKADLLLKLLNEPLSIFKKGPFSLNDGRSFAEWLNTGTGRKLRIATSAELLEARKLLGNKNDREWTESARGTYTYDLYVLSSAKQLNHFSDIPDSRSNGPFLYSFRLVEDKI